MTPDAVVFLPYPPTANNLFPGAHRRHKSKQYMAWLQEAQYCLNQQQAQPSFAGALRVVYEYGRPDKRRRDLGNLEKAPSDFLVQAGIIRDDCDIVELTLRWADDGLVGCRAMIWKL